MLETVKSVLLSQAEGKALGPHPSFMDPGTPVIEVGGSRDSRPRITQRESMRHTQAYGGDQAMDWVMDCVRFTADTVAGADYHFEKPKKATGRKLPGDLTEPPQRLADLFDQPNPYMDYVELMELLIIDLLLVGNAYWFKWRTNDTAQPLAIYRLAPSHVKIITKPWGVGGYEYDVPGQGKLTIQPDEVIHFKLANPHSPYYGLGLVQGAGRAADIELALTDSQASYYENHAMPSLAVQTERRVPRDVFRKLRAQLRARTQGPKNAGDLLVLEAGLKLAAIAPNASEAAFAELSRLSRDRIFAWFRIHPKLLGIADEPGGSDKVADAQRTFDTKTARPLMNKIQRKVSRELTMAWMLHYAIDYEYQMPPEELFRLAGQFGTLPGVIVDEVRAYAKLGPHPDPEIGSITINVPGEELDEDGQGGFADRNLPGEAGRPPQGENTKAFQKGGALPKGARARKAGGLKPQSLDEILFELNKLEGKASAPLPGEQRPDDTLAERRTSDVDAIAADLKIELADAAQVLERSVLDHVEGKAMGSNDLIKRVRNSPAWTTFSNAVAAALDRAAHRSLSTAAVHHKFESEEDIDYAALAKELVHRPDGVRGIVKTFKENLIAKIKPVKEKERAVVLAEVQRVVTEWTDGQAEAIALSEAVRGYNLGTIEAGVAAGALDFDVVEEEDAPDEPCQIARGQTWPAQQARENLLEHPRCRRAFVPRLAIA